VKDDLIDQDYESALRFVEKIDKSTSELLYLYEKGLILHYDNEWVESNLALESAEDLYEDLYTKSLSRVVGSLFTSDNVLKYRGERHEAALIHYYKILNYLYLDDPEGALVECRKLNNRLTAFTDEADSLYSNDAFLQYLTGMVYLVNGELNDASVSLRAARGAFKQLEDRYDIEMPRSLYCDLITVAEARGELSMAAAYRDSVGGCDTVGVDTGNGALNLFIESGYTSYKIEKNIVIPIYKDEIDDIGGDDFALVLVDRHGVPVDAGRKVSYMLRVALPELVGSPEPFMDAGVRVYVDDRARGARAPVVENIDRLTQEAFEARRGMILLKTVSRALAKYLAKEAAGSKEVWAGWLVNAFGFATESADTRSWATLPQTIRMARLVLPEGTHDIELTLYGYFIEDDETILIEDIEITAGRTTFLNVRVY
ncbi:MAG: hypothetical protein JSW50_08855, partial [Candidatus Latescibacterota bacterium]